MELFTSSGVTLDSIGKSTVREEEEERRRKSCGGEEEEEEAVCRARLPRCREVLSYRCYKTALCSLAFYAVMLCM